MADIEVTVTPVPNMLLRNGLTLGNAAMGVYFDSEATLSGAVGNLDFGGTSIKRYIVNGDLSGSFTFPPINGPALIADNQSVTVTVVFFQDNVGGRQIPLEILFANADERVGLPLVDESPNGITVVDIAIRRASGVTRYTAYFEVTIDAEQIVSGVFSPAQLPAATSSTAGIVTIAPGSGGAAAGNHTHVQMLSAKLTVEMSAGGTLINGDYTLQDAPTAGTIVRLTGLQLFGGTTPTATVTARISGTAVTGTGTSVTSTTASADAGASAANTFVARQLLQINIASVAGSPTMLTGWMHYALNNEPWSP